MKIEPKQFRTLTRADQIQLGQCFVFRGGGRMMMVVGDHRVVCSNGCIPAVDLESGRHIEVPITEPVELVNATVVEE